MATLTIQICPTLPYDCWVNFWDMWGTFEFYRTLLATADSKITSAKLQFEVKCPTSPFGNLYGTVVIKVNDKEVFNSGWRPAAWYDTVSGEVDIGDKIIPPIGFTGQGANKIGFHFENKYWFFWGSGYTIKKAYLILEYSAETPSIPTENPTGTSGTGLFGIENIDQMFASMMQLIIMVTIINLLINVIGEF